MLTFRAVRKVSQRPHVVSPLVVSLKPSSTKDHPKYRLCHNLRWLNQFVCKLSFKLGGVRDFAEQLVQGDHMIGIDLESGYFHVEVAERFRTLLGFEFQGEFFEFISLPFGLRCSAYFFQKLTSWSTEYIANELQLKSLVYLDDFAFAEAGHILTHSLALVIIERLQAFGWVIGFDKSSILPSKVLTLLGFILDTDQMIYMVPEKRISKMLRAVEEIVEADFSCSARQVQRVAGHINSMTLAFGMVCRLRSRYLLSFCRDACTSGLWDSRYPLFRRAIEELLWWRDNLTSIRPRSILSYLRKPDFTLSADASDSAMAAWLERTPDGPCKEPIHHVFDVHERSLGSMLRELHGYSKCISWLAKNYDLRGKCILLVGDALSAVHVCANGGSQQMDDDGTLPVLEIVLGMFSLLWNLEAVLILHWRPREFLDAADGLSKVIDRHDFSLSVDALELVFQQFGPCLIDAFGSERHHVCDRFFSKFHSLSSSGRDAFCQDWHGHRILWLPPFTPSCLSRVLDKIQCDVASGILIVPYWPRQTWFKRLFGQMRTWIVDHLTLPGSALVANDENCFFGHDFVCEVLVIRVRPPRNLFILSAK